MQGPSWHGLAIIIGYLLGSIPTAYIAGRIKRGVDIRTVGGGNMGALNSARELGSAWGAAVLLIDIAKGSSAVLIAGSLGVAQVWVFLAGFAAVLGHCWPVFLKFRGGKGAATAMGVFFASAPPEFACSIPLMIGVILYTSNVTLGMTVGFVFFPLFLWVFGQPLSLIVYAILVIIFLLIRYLPTARRGYAKAHSIKDFIFERKYKPWQTPRN